MRVETLRELGGVGTIVESYLEDTLATLSRDENELAAEVFQYMVTPSGRKIAQTIAELAGAPILPGIPARVQGTDPLAEYESSP